MSTVALKVSEAISPRLELTTIRGIACLALVAYHVIGPTVDNGLHLPEFSSWHRVINSLDFIRMPLFAILSGYLYAGHRATVSSLGVFAVKKSKRLIVPLLFATTVMFVLRRTIYGDPTQLSTALLFHYQHLWFLQALALLFIAIALWDAFARPSWVGLCVASFAAVMVSRSFEVTDFFSLNGALYLAPFFLCGTIFRVEPGLLRRQDLFTLAAWLLVIVLVVQQATVTLPATPVLRTSLPAAVCGLAAGYLLFVACPRIALLEQMGNYSFTIYLWHSIAAATARTAVEHYAQPPVIIEFLILLTVGLGVPIAIHRAVASIPIVSLLVAGIQGQHHLTNNTAKDTEMRGGDKTTHRQQHGPSWAPYRAIRLFTFRDIRKASEALLRIAHK